MDMAATRRLSLVTAVATTVLAGVVIAVLHTPPVCPTAGIRLGRSAAVAWMPWFGAMAHSARRR
jgi:hypothetical protein